jgi:glutamate racemase
MADKRPIGIFDSGTGGLTIAHAVKKLMPKEKLLFFGDTAHLPYGDKSKELVQGYAVEITRFLLNEKNCKAVVIACNTASAAAYELLRDHYKGMAPVINVIDPMIECIVADDSLRHVGIIATKTTIATGVYQEKLLRRKPELRFTAMATPLLASMIEEGFYNDNISHAVLQSYLSAPELQDIDSLVLACTHYPLIRNEIAAFFENKIKIFDPADEVAARLKWILEKENLRTPGWQGHDEFFVSDYTEAFEKTTRMFYGQEVKLEGLNIWETH